MIIRGNLKILIIALFFCFNIDDLYSQKLNKFGVSIIDYGAKPASSWQGAIDNYFFIQKAIDENPGKQIAIPSGYYLISKPLQINHGVQLIGENKYSTVIKPLSCDGIIINSSDVSLENFFVYGDGHTAILVKNVRNSKLSDILIQNVTNGIILQNAWNTKITNIDITINPNQNPKVSKSIVLIGQCVNNLISDSRITAVEVGIEIQKNSVKSEGLMISNVVISSAKVGLKCEGILSLHLNNNIIDLCEDHGLVVENTGGLLVSNCWIASQGKNRGSSIRLSASWDSHFSTNNIKCGIGDTIILLEKESNNNIFVNNTFEFSDSKQPVFQLDKSTSLNTIKDNNFKLPKGGSGQIKDLGKNNISLSNLGLITK